MAMPGAKAVFGAISGCMVFAAALWATAPKGAGENAPGGKEIRRADTLVRPSGLKAAKPPRGNVVVEAVKPGSAAEKAGIRAGDCLLAWTRRENPPANPREAKGEFRSIYDWKFIEAEELPRGIVALTAERDGRTVEYEVPSGRWGFKARPWMDPLTLGAYESGKELLSRGEAAKGLSALEALARSAEAKKALVLACWLFTNEGDGWVAAAKWDEAHAAYDRALASARALGEPAAVGDVLESIAIMYARRSDFAKAEESYESLKELREKAWGSCLASAEVLQSLAGMAWKRGDLGKAEELCGSALAVFEKLAPSSLEVAGSLNNLGLITWQRGDLPTAENYYQRALALKASVAPDSLDLASSLNNLGNIAYERGDFSAAEDYYQRTLAIRMKLDPSSPDVGASFGNLGAVARARGDLAAAEDYGRRGLAIYEKLEPEGIDVGSIQQNLGSVATDRGDLESAQEDYQRALSIYEKTEPDSLDVAAILNNLGTLALMRHDYGAAETFVRRGLDIKQKAAPGSLDVARSQQNLGAVAFERGDLASAEDSFEKARSIFGKYASGSSEEAESLHSLGRLYARRGDRTKALDFDSRALTSLESQVGRLGGSEETRSRFAAKRQDYYRDYMQLLIEQGGKDDAFGILERSRARRLLEMLAERDLVFSADIPPELERERRMTNADYDSAQADLDSLSPQSQSDEVSELMKRLADIRRRQEEIKQRIRKLSPRLASLQYPEPLSLARARAALDPGTLLLSYSVGQTETILFALGPRVEDFEVYRLPTGGAELQKDVRLFRGLIQSHQDVRSLSSKLSDILLEPAKKRIEKAACLLICPDGPLHFLPFAALKDPASGGRRPRYLVEAKPLSVILSVTVFSELKRGRRVVKEPLLVAFGDPWYPEAATAGQLSGAPMAVGRAGVPGMSGLAPLPWTRKEVLGLADLYPGRAAVYLGAEATESRAKSLPKEARIIHFACHGVLDERFPLDSALVLSPPAQPGAAGENGRLQAWEIFESVRMDADLVTLSACETGLGAELGGEGIVGLTRAFQYAGALSVVASMWDVSDESTSEFMKRFHKGLKAGMTKAEALRDAQKGFIASGIQRPPVKEGVIGQTNFDASHPYYWAAFELTGDWK